MLIGANYNSLPNSVFAWKTRVTDWMITRKNSAFPKSLFCCMTNDELNGTFITAHIGEVQRLCSVHEIAMSDFVIDFKCIMGICFLGFIFKTDFYCFKYYIIILS